jgi:hypothetical protein
MMPLLDYEVQEIKNVRSQYNEFLSGVKKIVADDQILSDELHSAAYLIYHTVIDSNKSLNQK